MEWLKDKQSKESEPIIMMCIKAGRPLIDLTKVCYQANLPLLIIGKHGIGKSEILQQAAQELGIGCVVYDLSVMEPPDLIGLPGKEKKRTVYYPPKSLPTGGRGLLVFEELNRAERYMRAPTLNLLTARRLNDYELPRGWLPVAAVNPPERDYEVYELDAALRSRFDHVAVEADRDQWLAWAANDSIHPDVIAYVRSDPSVFDAPESNPRAWKYVSDVLTTVKDAKEQRHLLQVAVSGLVGCERAGSFLGFLSNHLRSLSAEDVLSHYSKYRRQLQKWVANGRMDLLHDSLWAVKTQLQSKSHFEAAKSKRRTWQNLGQFLGDLPGDLREDAERFFVEHDYPLHRGGRAAR